MKTRFIAVAALLVSGSVAVAAADMFKQLDADQSGAISKEEAAGQTALVEQWTEIDANTDGQVDMEEFSRFEAAETPPAEK